MRLDWEKVADSLAEDVRKQKAEITRMRPVFRAVKRCLSAEGWIMNGEHIVCKPDAVGRLEDACARAARKAKGKR